MCSSLECVAHCGKGNVQLIVGREHVTHCVGGRGISAD